MGRVYYQELNGVAIPSQVGDVDIWSVLAATNEQIKLHGFELTSAAIAGAVVNVVLDRITALGSGGSLVTPELRDPGDSVFAGIAHVADTTSATVAGELQGYQWEQVGPIGHIYTPEMRWKTANSGGFALRWNTATTAATVSGWVCWEEL